MIRLGKYWIGSRSIGNLRIWRPVALAVLVACVAAGNVGGAEVGFAAIENSRGALDLWAFDTETGRSRYSGPLEIGDDVLELALSFASDGRLFAIDTAPARNSRLYEIDPATGSLTTLLHLDARLGDSSRDFTVDTASGIGYVMHAGMLNSLNLETGQSTALGRLNVSGIPLDRTRLRALTARDGVLYGLVPRFALDEHIEHLAEHLVTISPDDVALESVGRAGGVSAQTGLQFSARQERFFVYGPNDAPRGSVDSYWLDAETLEPQVGPQLLLSRIQSVAISSDFRLEPQQELIPAGAVWRFDDRGVDLGTSWREVAFDDGAWPRGSAKFGIGNDNENTLVNPIPNTLYFRHEFNIEDPLDYRTLELHVLRDDGVAVYLNGHEILRDALAANATFADLATRPAQPEEAFWSFSVAADSLVAGTNVIAVELHDISHSLGEDSGFDLQLVGQYAPKTADFDGSGAVDASDINALGEQIQSDEFVGVFDLDYSRIVDSADLAYMIESVLATHFGDANLDGTVDAVDLAIWNSHRFMKTRGWEYGDFNLDGFIDGADFNLWNRHRSAIGQLRLVPETHTGLSILLGAATLFRLTRRTRGGRESFQDSPFTIRASADIAT
jgi:hypothetical protein